MAFSYRTALWSRARHRNGRTLAITRSAALGALSYEQEGFRWRNDDGSEATATWKDAQDVSITLAAAATARLRVLVNATNDPPSQGYVLEYRRAGGSWREVRPE